MFQKIADRAVAVAASIEWLFVGTSDNTLMLLENRPAFGYPKFREYPVGRPIRGVNVTDNLILLQSEDQTISPFHIHEPVTSYPQLVYNTSGCGTKSVTVNVNEFTFTLTDSVFRSRLLACKLFPYKNQVLAVAYTDGGKLMLWRLEDRPYLVKHISDGPLIQEPPQMAVLMYAEDEVRVVVAAPNGSVFESALFEVGQSWTGMVPMVRDVGDKNFVYVEAEDEFDICA